jgi:hypothetical protein
MRALFSPQSLPLLIWLLGCVTGTGAVFAQVLGAAIHQ